MSLILPPTALPPVAAEVYTIPAPVKSVIFDFGGVLAKPDENELVAYLVTAFGVSEDEIREQQVSELQWIRVNDTEFGIWKKYAKEKCNIDLTDEWRVEYAAVKMKAVKELPGIRELLVDLRNQGYSLEILSNFEEWMEPLLNRFGYKDPNLFSHLYLSYETKQEKPSREAYEQLLTDLRLQGNETLFIDDQIKNIEAAKELGIDAIHFTSAEELRQALILRGILRD
jgi:HAD superfamily hydrolase (TIGR01509 family)